MPMVVEHCGGSDGGGVGHTGCIVDGRDILVDRFAIRHDLVGLDDLSNRLRRHGDPADVPIGIARPPGLVVDLPGEAGQPDPS